MECNRIRGVSATKVPAWVGRHAIPDSAALHPGYGGDDRVACYMSDLSNASGKSNASMKKTICPPALAITHQDSMIRLCHSPANQRDASAQGLTETEAVSWFFPTVSACQNDLCHQHPLPEHAQHIMHRPQDQKRGEQLNTAKLRQHGTDPAQ
jgi:hypothetical protein